MCVVCAWCVPVSLISDCDLARCFLRSIPDLRDVSVCVCLCVCMCESCPPVPPLAACTPHCSVRTVHFRAKAVRLCSSRLPSSWPLPTPSCVGAVWCWGKTRASHCSSGGDVFTCGMLGGSCPLPLWMPSPGSLCVLVLLVESPACSLASAARSASPCLWLVGTGLQ